MRSLERPRGGRKITAASRPSQVEPDLLASVAGWRVAGSRYLDASLLGFMVVSITAINLLWVSLDSGRIYWDFARHLGDSLFYKDLFTLSDPFRIFEGYTRYPPLMYWVTDAFYAVLGTDMWVAILSNVVFLSILVFATYGIGKILWSRTVGLLSAMFVVTSPMFVTQLREYMLDAPLSAMVALALYFLIRSENFAHRRSSSLFGITCGLGLLIKWTLPFYLFLPVCVSGVTAVLGYRRERSANRLFNLALGGVCAFLVSAVWYVPHYAQFRDDVRYSTSLPASIQGSPPVDSLASALWYFWSLVNNELYLIPALLFMGGMVAICRRDESASRNSPLVLSIVGAYIALSLIALKDFRYAMPMMPAIAVVATSWLTYLNPRARRWLTGGLIAYSILAFVVISFGTSLLPKSITIPLKPRSFTSDGFDLAPPESVRVTGIVVFAQRGFRVGQPSGQRWYQDEIFKEIAARRGESFSYYGRPLETIWFTTWSLRYYGLKYHAAWVSAHEARFLIVRGRVPAGATNGFVKIREYPLAYDGPVRLYERV